MPGDTRAWRRGVLLFLGALLPRLLYVIVTPDPTGNYFWLLSSSILDDRWLALSDAASTRVELLYPYFIAVVRWLAPGRPSLVLAAQSVVGALGAPLLYRLTVRLTGRERTGVVAALLFAWYPYLVRQAAAFDALTIYGTLVIAATLAFVRLRDARGGAVAGVAFGLAVLVRVTAASIWVLAVADLALRRRFRELAALASVTLLLVLPAAARNYAVDGSLLPTRGGENLLVGNSTYADRFIPTYDVDLMVRYVEMRARTRLQVAAWEGGPDVARRIDEVEWDMAWEWIRAHPWRTLRLKLLNVAYTFSPLIIPRVGWSSGSCVVYLPGGGVRVEGARVRPWTAEAIHATAASVVLLAALAGLAVRRRRLADDRMLLYVLAAVTVACVVFFPTTRLRMPAEFVLMFYAACGLTWIGDRVLRRPSSG